MVGSSPPGVAMVFRRKLCVLAFAVDGRGPKNAGVTYFSHNVTYFRSLAVLRGGFVKLYSLVYSLTRQPSGKIDRCHRRGN